MDKIERKQISLNFKRTNAAGFEIIQMISEIKKISDDLREHAYTWNLNSQHPVKINAISRSSKLLMQRLEEVEEKLTHKK